MNPRKEQTAQVRVRETQLARLDSERMGAGGMKAVQYMDIVIDAWFALPQERRAELLKARPVKVSPPVSPERTPERLRS